MNAQQLKNAILQEAIEGRLVPQDPNDEPASVLLARIRKEKERLVKEGKLKKKDLEVKPISEDEIPFEIPESWEWVRLGCISKLFGGFAFKSHEYTSEGSRVIRISDISEEGFVNKSIVRHFYNENLNQYVIRPKDILMAMTGGTVGKSLFVKTMPEEKMLLNQRVALIRCYDIHVDYINYVIKSNFIQSVISDAKNSTNDNISMTDIYNFLIPLPPFAEQYRIVAKIEELLPKVEEYGKAQDALNKLNTELPERLKKSILQEAIEGRLVPQDPNEEPASVLLAKIRKEKEQLVKEGKLKKKDLIETPITEDEIPFDIPDSWEWVRLKSVCDYIHRGKSPKYGEKKILPIMAQKCNQWDRIYTDRCLFAQEDTIERYTEEQFLRVGDVIINSTGGGTVGRTGYVSDYVFVDYKKFVVDSHVTIVRGNKDVLGKYIYYYLISPLIQFGLEDRCSGSTNQIELGTATICDYLFPLPPLAEQFRIVEKLEQLLGETDKLKIK